MDFDTNLILEKFILPMLIAIVAWILKDVVVGWYVARRDEARREWLYRLREIYCPIFFWSGVILFRGQSEQKKTGVTELASLMSKAASLLPIREYFVFVRLLEQATGQHTTPPDIHEIKKARDWVYSQIEAINFALFKEPGYFDPARQVDMLASLRAVWRLGMGALIQLVLWLLFIALIFSLYLAATGQPLAAIVIGVVVLALVIGEFKRRYDLHSELKRRMKS